jgi:hypothetical protein
MDLETSLTSVILVNEQTRRCGMLDMILLLIFLSFFLITLGLVRGCDSLRR